MRCTLRALDARCVGRPIHQPSHVTAQCGPLPRACGGVATMDRHYLISYRKLEMKRSNYSKSDPRAKVRANVSFCIVIVFFTLYGVIMLTELFVLEREPVAAANRSRWAQELQSSDSYEKNPYEQVLPTPTIPLDGVWQPVSGTRYKFFVYSAYIERRRKSLLIRIIAVTKTRGYDKVHCRISMATNRILNVPATTRIIRENWNYKYSACYLLCPVDGKLQVDDLFNSSVAVIISPGIKTPSNLLKVKDTQPQQGIDNQVHICVKPFHLSYFRDAWLIEWMEANLLMGVSHFYMYNKSLSENVSCVLEHYRKKGIVTLLPWKLPVHSIREIRTQGMFAAFNDCLYRAMPSAGWLLPIDVDELVFPRPKRLLHQYLNSLRKTASPKKMPSALVFRNAFFYTQWDDDDNTTVTRNPLLTSRKTRRWSVPHAVNNRSKYAVRPYDAIELGNHFVWEFIRGHFAAAISPERGVLHHYRMVCEFGGVGCLNVPSVVDRTAQQWADELLPRVENRRQALARCSPSNPT